MQAASALNRIFAANRAAGHIALEVGAQGGVTRRVRVGEDGPLRVRFPGPDSPSLEAMIVNTAGGIAGGDRHRIDISVGNGSRLSVTRPRRRRYIARSARPPMLPSGFALSQARSFAGCRRKPSCSIALACAAASKSIFSAMLRC